MNPRRVRFVAEFLTDLNGTQAAIRAGYAPTNARFTSARLLANVAIQYAIAAAQRERRRRTQVTADAVVQELARIAFTDLRNILSWGPAGVRLKSSDQLTPEAAAMVAEIVETANAHGTTRRIKLHPKVQALELLAKHLGMLKDRLELTGDDGPAITLYLPDNGRDPKN